LIISTFIMTFKYFEQCIQQQHKYL